MADASEDPRCVCAVCLFPPAKRRRGVITARSIVRADACSNVLDEMPTSMLPPPPVLFLAERLPHIRCYCLSVCGARDAQLTGVDVAATAASICMDCTYFEVEASQTVQASRTCRIELDFGEPLDHRTGATVAFQDGFAYIRLPLAPEAARCEGRLEGAVDEVTGGTAALDDGRVSQQLREEAGLYHRAAAQRRSERGVLEGAWLRCRQCHPTDHPPLLRIDVAQSLPDVDVSSLVDFMQCCQEIDFDWRCVFPPVEEAPEEPAAREAASDSPPPVCFLGAHSLHMCTKPPPPSVARIDLAGSFREAPCYRHTTAPQGVGQWAPLRCTRCSSTLGAVRLPSGSRTSSSDVPAWFDAEAPPECGCTLQLLKGAVVGASVAEGDLTNQATGLLQGYSMAALIADRILRVAEEDEGEHTRQFIVSGASCGEGATPDVAIMLLSPYVTLATNQPHVAAVSTSGSVVDALKVLYTTDLAAIAGLSGKAHRLVLPEAEERARVIASLTSSTDVLTPAARAVGAFRVGFLPVAPTWD